MPWPSYLAYAGTLTLTLALVVALINGWFVWYYLRDLTLNGAAVIRGALSTLSAIAIAMSVVWKLGATREQLPGVFELAPYAWFTVFFAAHLLRRRSLSPAERALEARLERLPRNATDAELEAVFAEHHEQVEREKEQLRLVATTDPQARRRYLAILKKDLRNRKASRSMFAKHAPVLLPHLDQEAAVIEREIRSLES